MLGKHLCVEYINIYTSYIIYIFVYALFVFTSRTFFKAKKKKQCLDDDHPNL